MEQLKLLSFTQQSGAEQFWVSVHPNVSICAVRNSRWHRGSGNAPHQARKQGPSDGAPFDDRKSHQEKPACTVASLLFCLSPRSLGVVLGSLRGLLLQRRRPPLLPRVHGFSDSLPPDSDPTHKTKKSTPELPPTSPSLRLHSAPSTPKAPSSLGVPIQGPLYLNVPHKQNTSLRCKEGQQAITGLCGAAGTVEVPRAELDAGSES